MRHPCSVFALFALVCLGWAPALAQPKMVDGKVTNVKTQTSWNPSGAGHAGVVDAIDGKSLTITGRQFKGDVEDVSVVIHPIDLMVEGKMVKDTEANFAYRWQDVKKGDRVRLNTRFDDVEKKMYCLEICIERRPGAELPESQDPKRDTRYVESSLFNDIDNGLDVSERTIAELFPQKQVFDPKTGRQLRFEPGGLPGEYRGKLNATRDKLDAIRAKKKEADLKVTPPEKK